MNVVCPGAYTWRNKGDAALIVTMLCELRRVLRQPMISILSDSPAIDAITYGVPVLGPLYGGTLSEPGVESQWQPRRRSAVAKVFHRYIGWRFESARRLKPSNEPGALAAAQAALARRVRTTRERVAFHCSLAYYFLIIRLFGKRSHRFAPSSTRASFRALCEADLLVFVPGGYMIAPHSDHTYWYRHVAAVFIGHWLRLPIYMYSCTVGPFHGYYNRWLATRALSLPTAVFLREESSLDAFRRIAPSVPATLAADVGFLLPKCSERRVSELRAHYLPETGRRIRVGISVREYTFPGHPDATGQRTRYLRAVADLALYFIDEIDAEVHFVPQVLADEVNDLSVSKEVQNLAGNPAHSYLIVDDLSPQDLKGLYSCFDVFVGVRMHANIFALSAGVPTVAIAYEPKTMGIMGQLGLARYALNIRTLDSASLLERADALLSDLEAVKSELRTSLPLVEASARSTADLIAKHVRSTQ